MADETCPYGMTPDESAAFEAWDREPYPPEIQDMFASADGLCEEEQVDRRVTWAACAKLYRQRVYLLERVRDEGIKLADRHDALQAEVKRLRAGLGKGFCPVCEAENAQGRERLEAFLQEHGPVGERPRVPVRKGGA